MPPTAPRPRKPIVLVEVNECPNEIWEAYARRNPRFARLLGAADRYETITPDRIQLDPWIAWPTLHRGVNDEAHGLLRLGQDTAQAEAAYPPVWRMLQARGVPVGVWGSLFSSCEEDLGGYAFFVPDVFAPHDRVSPASLQDFQNFNLAMTRASARNADSQIASGGARTMLALALQGKLRPGTLARVGTQLLREKLDARKVSRRRNSQTDLHADLFLDTLKRHPAGFATFYTNNVAAAMHRFWSASMPKGSINSDRLADAWVAAYADEVFAALDTVARLLERLRSGECGPVTILVAGALGQEEIPAENHSSYLTITDIKAFVSTLLDRVVPAVDFTCLPTMVPDFTLRFTHAAEARALAERLASLEVGGYRPVETLERMRVKELVGTDPRMSHIRHHYEDDTDFKHAITYKQSDANTVHISFQIDGYQGAATALIGNRRTAFASIGLGQMPHDEGVNCTAQHCAKGALFVLDGEEPGDFRGMKVISVLDVVPSLLTAYGLPVPAKLKGEASIAL